MDVDGIIAEDFIVKYPYQAAQLLEGFQDEVVAEFMQEIHIDSAHVLLNAMSFYKASKCLGLMPIEFCKVLLELSDVIQSESWLRACDESLAARLLETLPPDLAASLKLKLEQSPDTVGLFMNPVITVKRGASIEEALEIVKKNREGIGPHIYITDDLGVFVGGLRLEDLVFAQTSCSISELVNTTIPKFYSDIPLKSIVDHPWWYQYSVIPVVDRSEKLLGSLPFAKTQEISAAKPGQMSKDLLETSLALGELYRIGLTGFLQSVGN